MVCKKSNFSTKVLKSQAPEGNVLINGRDSSGAFVYLGTYDGWANADPTYIDLGAFELNLLPVRES